MKTIAIIGMGALGTETTLLLSKENVKLILFDGDMIEEKNLARQKLFTKKDIGKSKALQAKKIINNKNIKAYDCFITKKNVKSLKCDIILDCTDNLKTRFIINKYSLENKIPWIYSSISDKEGCVFIIIPGKTPCFNCIFQGKKIQEYCININHRLASKISKFQVKEALNIINNKAVTKELVYISLNKETKIKVKKNPYCKVCGRKQ